MIPHDPSLLLFGGGMSGWEIRQGDALDRLREMDEESVHCCITSPPYFGLRDYGVEGQIGLENTPDAYIAKLVEVFAEVKRVLRNDGTLWLNLGDSYAGGGNGARDPDRWPKQSRNNNGDRIQHAKKGTGCKKKDLLMIPALVALGCRADGWWLRSKTVWHKPNVMPESVRDRPTVAHEEIFLLSKSSTYWYDDDAIREPPAPSTLADGRLAVSREHRGNPRGANQCDARQAKGHPVPTPPAGRNCRNVWTVPNVPYPGAHFATFPPKLVEPMVLAGCPRGGTVLDPFAGSGTTLEVAVRQGRSAIGIELNPEYMALVERRLAGVTPSMFDDMPSSSESPRMGRDG